jgi:glutamate racemase
MVERQPIGVFDSGYGGLTVLKEIIKKLPQYDYLYLGDNARAPYGNRSFETVYQYTLDCVKWFFEKNCHLVILACNTASAKALRNIQQKDLPNLAPYKRVLGVIRPTAEVIGNYSKTREVGILATNGTVQSGSYKMEINKQFPDISVQQEACPIWVPLVENNELTGPGTEYFIKKHIDSLLQKSKNIDTVLLACTHYPLLADVIKKYLPADTQLLSQGEIVADSLVEYLHRHPEIEQQCSKNGEYLFYTTDSVEDFDNHASLFFGEEISSRQVNPPTPSKGKN